MKEERDRGSEWKKREKGWFEGRARKGSVKFK